MSKLLDHKKIMAKLRERQAQKWCQKNGWSDLFFQGGNKLMKADVRMIPEQRYGLTQLQQQSC